MTHAIDKGEPMHNQLSLGDPPPLPPVGKDEIDARIRELRCDPQWCELYEGASEKLLRGFIRYDMESHSYSNYCTASRRRLGRLVGLPHISMNGMYRRARWYTLVETNREH